MQLVPNSLGSQLLEGNDCHKPAGSSEGGQFCSKDDMGGGSNPVGEQPAIMGRFGREPTNDWSRASLWYTFPEVGGAYEARRVKTVSLGSIAKEMDQIVYKQGQAALAEYLEKLAPLMPEGYVAVYRIGSKEGGLSGRNAGNAKGLTEFIDQMTQGGESKIAYGFDLDKGDRYISIYAVKIDKKAAPGEKVEGGGFRKSTWGR